MGYDMTIAQPTQEARNRKEAARVRFDRAIAAREALNEVDGYEFGPAFGIPETARPGKPHSEAWLAAQKEIDAAYDELNAPDTYFRLNVWGMSRMRTAMHRLGMLVTDYEVPPWPEAKDYGMTDEQEGDLHDRRYAHPDAPLAANEQAFLDAIEAHMRWSVPDAPGIPIHKLGSNDAWLITDLECTTALSMYDTADVELRNAIREDWIQDSGGNYFDQWIEFLRVAARCGGFIQG